MTICYGWLIEQQVILMQMEGIITPTEFRKWADELNVYYDKPPFRCLHIVIDTSNVAKIPSAGYSCA